MKTSLKQAKFDYSKAGVTMKKRKTKVRFEDLPTLKQKVFMEALAIIVLYFCVNSKEQRYIYDCNHFGKNMLQSILCTDINA